MLWLIEKKVSFSILFQSLNTVSWWHVQAVQLKESSEWEKFLGHSWSGNSLRVCQLRARRPLLRAWRNPDLNPYQFHFTLAGMHSVSMNDTVHIVISQEVSLHTVLIDRRDWNILKHTHLLHFWLCFARASYVGLRLHFFRSSCSLCKIIVILVHCDTDSVHIDKLWSVISYQSNLDLQNGPALHTKHRICKCHIPHFNW